MKLPTNKLHVTLWVKICNVSVFSKTVKIKAFKFCFHPWLKSCPWKDKVKFIVLDSTTRKNRTIGLSESFVGAKNDKLGAKLHRNEVFFPALQSKTLHLTDFISSFTCRWLTASVVKLCRKNPHFQGRQEERWFGIMKEIKDKSSVCKWMMIKNQKLKSFEKHILLLSWIKYLTSLEQKI